MIINSFSNNFLKDYEKYYITIFFVQGLLAVLATSCYGAEKAITINHGFVGAYPYAGLDYFNIYFLKSKTYNAFFS